MTLQALPSEARVSAPAGIPSSRVTLREVLATLGPHDRAREATLRAFRAWGGDLDHVDGVHAHRVRMLEALLAAEDAIEFTADGRVRPYDAEDRRAVRHVRRRLEAEVCP